MEEKSPKTTNNKQFNILVLEIEKHPELAKRAPIFGPYRAQSDTKWEEIAAKLNAKGPPERTVREWKKVFCDLRLRVKKKLAENQAAGCDQNILSDMETTLGKVLQLVDAVKPKGATFGVPLVPGFSTVTVRTVDRDPLNDIGPPPLAAISSIKTRSSPSPTPPPDSPPRGQKRRSEFQSNHLFRRQLQNQTKYMKITQDMIEVMDRQSLCLEKLTKAVERQEHLIEQQLALMEKQTIAIERQAAALERMAEL